VGLRAVVAVAAKVGAPRPIVAVAVAVATGVGNRGRTELELVGTGGLVGLTVGTTVTVTMPV